MFKVLILVCSMNLSPADCQADTAVQIIDGPDAANEVQCGLYGQAYIAGAPGVGPRDGEYVKIRCTRTTIGKTVG